MNNFGKIVFNHTCKNESSRFILVGNASDFISDHETHDEAVQALNKINVADSTWAVVTILAPNETKTLNNLEKTIYEKVDYDDSYYNLDNI